MSERIAVFVHGRNRFPDSILDCSTPPGKAEPPAFVFDRDELWNGKTDDQGRHVCNGLIADWVNWMRSQHLTGFDQAEKYSTIAEFTLLELFLKQLAPDENGTFVAGPPRRLSVSDTREISTIFTPWDQQQAISITLASAGFKRILELVYALVWLWREQSLVSQLRRTVPPQELFILIDEPELHLHPKWQQSILPSLLELGSNNLLHSSRMPSLI